MKKTRLLEKLQGWLRNRKVPRVLAFAAVVLMIPALWSGLAVDDLVQRAFQLKHDELPPSIRDTGLPLESGTLGAVVCDLFGFGRHRESVLQAKNYGLLPWWTRDDTKAAIPGPQAVSWKAAVQRLLENVQVRRE